MAPRVLQRQGTAIPVKPTTGQIYSTRTGRMIQVTIYSGIRRKDTEGTLSFARLVLFQPDVQKMTTKILILGIVLLSMMACKEADGPELLTNIHFPQVREDGASPAALLKGELVLEGGCLRVKSLDGTDHLLIWPQRFKLSVDGRDIRISADSGVSLSVGEKISIGGGEVPLRFLQTLVEQPVPSDCPGPYWLVGEVPGS